MRRVLVLCKVSAGLSGKWTGGHGHVLFWIPVTSKEEALGQLQQQRVDALLVGAEHADLKFVEAAQRVQPSALVVFLATADTDPALVKLASRLDSFVCLSRRGKGEELARELEQILFPRAELRHRVRGGLRVEIPGSQQTYPLWDISNHGLSWIMELGATEALVLPETRIGQLLIRRNNEVVLQAPRTIVRNVVTLSDGTRGDLPTHYRVGASFAPPVEILPKAEKYLRHRAKIMASLQRALASDGIVFHPPYKGRRTWRTEQGDVVPEDPELFTVTGRWPDEWKLGTVLQGSFELAGWGHVFFCSVLQRKELAKSCILSLSTPPIIKSSKMRDARRCMLPDPSPVAVRVRSPFLDHTLEYSVVEVSAQGLSFRLAGHDTTLPPGTRLEEVVVRGLAAEPLSATGVVLFVRPGESAKGQGEVHCGICLTWCSEEESIKAADAMVQLQSPKVTSGQGVSFDELWSFFKRAGFIYPEKEESLRPVISQVRENMSRLLQSPQPSILKTVVYRDQGEVFGHMSLLRAYQDTWIVQHLSADPSGTRSLFAARDANLGIADYINQTSSILWLKSYSQPSKQFPDRVLGGFARKMMGHPSSDLRVFSYLVSPAIESGERAFGPSESVEVRPWTSEDYKYIEAFFVDRGRWIDLGASDISQERLELAQIAAVYRTLGLERGREVWVAERHGRMVGFALVEFSSIGLNLSDITNHAAVYSWDEDVVALRALARFARGRHQQLGRSYCILLCDPSQVDVFEAVGFKKKRDYSCWTLDRSLLPEYREHTLQLLSLGHGRRTVK